MSLLASLIDQRIKLKRSGRNWTGLCPFHDEKTPSFIVFDDHYHCFGCGAHGDGIDFTTRIQGLSYSDAVRLVGSTGTARPRELPKTSNYAARLVAESRPVPGTLAERYLREARGLGDLTLPTEASFHPAVWCSETRSKHPALIVPCVENGRIVRVQAILLDPTTGAKASVTSPKLTFGAGYAHVPASFTARIPSDWTLLTEGPEDAIVLNAATGWRAEASLGAGSLGKPRYPAGTKLLIVGDTGEVGERQAKAAAAAHRERGAEVRVIFPPTGCKDANDLLKARGADAVRAWIMATPAAQAVALPAYYPPPIEDRDAAIARQTASIERTLRDGARLAAARREVMARRAVILAQMEEATPGQRGAITRRIIREVAGERGYGERLPRPMGKLITGAQASGKTTVSYQTVASLRGPLIVRVTEPTLEKAEETAADYRRVATATSLPALVVRGRSQPDPQRPGHKMCDRAEAAEVLARDGRSVIEHLCRGCKFAAACGDQRQRATIAKMEATGGVFFGATMGLFLPTPIPAADIFIGDERTTIEAVEVLTIPTSALDPFGISGIGIDTRDTMHALRAALHHPAPLRVLSAARIDRAELRTVTQSLQGALEAVTPPINSAMSDQEIVDRVEASERRHIRSALAVVAAIRREIDQPRDTLTAVQARGDKTVVSRLRRPVGIRNATRLLIDGTGDPELNRLVHGARLEHERIAIERRMSVTGTKGKQYSRQSITGLKADGKPLALQEASSERLRREVMEIVDSQPGTLLGATKRAVEALLEDDDDRPVAHFNAVRGMNRWERCRRVVAVGQESVSIRDLEDIARAFMADDPQPFVSMDAPAPAGWGYRYWPYKATRMRRMRNGSLSPIEVEVHPDPRCQAVLEQIREAEVVQTIDRTRPIFNAGREGVLLNNLCLDVTYDEIRTHRDLVRGGNPLERAYLATGILPLGARDLHKAHPDRFPSKKAAEKALGKYPPDPNKSSIWGWGVLNFRLAGQRGSHSRALVDLTRHRDPVAALTAVLGPLTVVDTSDPAPAPTLHRSFPRPYQPMVWPDDPDPWGGVAHRPEWTAGQVTHIFSQRISALDGGAMTTCDSWTKFLSVYTKEHDNGRQADTR